MVATANFLEKIGEPGAVLCHFTMIAMTISTTISLPCFGKYLSANRQHHHIDIFNL